MLAERHSPSHRKNHSKNISCAHLNIPDISTGSTGNLSENNTSLEDKELNQRLKILTDDLILNMDTVSDTYLSKMYTHTSIVTMIL